MNTSKKMLKRLLILSVVLIFLLTTSGVRVFYLQLVRGEELALKAESQQLKDTEITAMRGTIYDADGNVLAQSATVWNIFIDPLEIDDEEERILIVDKFSELFEYDDEERKALYEKTKAENHYEIVEKKVENNIKEKISQFISENRLGDCIGSEQTTKRYYGSP